MKRCFWLCLTCFLALSLTSCRQGQGRTYPISSGIRVTPLPVDTAHDIIQALDAKVWKFAVEASEAGYLCQIEMRQKGKRTASLGGIGCPVAHGGATGSEFTIVLVPSDGSMNTASSLRVVITSGATRATHVFPNAFKGLGTATPRLAPYQGDGTFVLMSGNKDVVSTYAPNNSTTLVCCFRRVTTPAKK